MRELGGVSLPREDALLKIECNSVKSHSRETEKTIDIGIGLGLGNRDLVDARVAPAQRDRCAQPTELDRAAHCGHGRSPVEANLMGRNDQSAPEYQ